MTTEAGPLRSVAVEGDHPDLIAADAAAARYADRAVPANTTRTYASAWRMFESWCEEVGLGALPASPSTVIRHLAHCADREGLAVSTLEVRTAAIADRHRAAKLADPTADASVRATMSGIRAEYADAGREPDRAPAADAAVVTAMVTTAHIRALTWRARVVARRDIALLMTMFAGARRRGDAAGLDIADLAPTTDGEQLLRMRLRGTKSSREEITSLYIARPADGPALLCPWCALHRWLVLLEARDTAAAREHRRQRRHGRTTIDPKPVDRAVGLAVQMALAADTADPHTHRCLDTWPALTDPEQPLFRPLTKAGTPQARRLSDRQIARIIAARGEAAGHPGLKGHSLRAGAATEGFDRGARTSDIQQLGGWATPATAQLYDRRRERRSARVDLGLNRPITYTTSNDSRIAHADPHR